MVCISPSGRRSEVGQAEHTGRRRVGLWSEWHCRAAAVQRRRGGPVVGPRITHVFGEDPDEASIRVAGGGDRRRTVRGAGPGDRRARPVVPADASGDHHRDRQEGPQDPMVTVVGESEAVHLRGERGSEEPSAAEGGRHRDRRLLRLGRDLGGEARQEGAATAPPRRWRGRSPARSRSWPRLT